MEKKKTVQQVGVFYENNPFTLAVNGLQLFFKLALPIAILTITLSIVGFLSGTMQQAPTASAPESPMTSEQAVESIRQEIAERRAYVESLSAEQWLTFIGIGLLILAAIVFVGTMLAGIFDYTAAQMSRNKKVTFTEAFDATISRFFPYLGLRLLVAMKVFLWSLLLIVPGIIMSVRYSLAGVSFFEKQLGANAATKDSNRIVKGAWLTTNGSFTLLNAITLGFIALVLKPGTSAMLYHQLDSYDKAHIKKPSAHYLSWLTLIIPYAFILMFIMFLAAVVITHGNFS